jgi:uncharacterized protein YkwD
MIRNTSSKTLARACAFIATAFVLQTQATAAMTIKTTPCNVPGLREAILQQVNAVRARGYRCGSEAFRAANAMAWNQQLFSAAAVHSRDMAQNNYFDHASPRGARAGDRADAQGYKWRSVGENIAAGEDFTAISVVDGWLKSPSHCRNIMNPEFDEVAVACEKRAGTTYGAYWTMVLGRR